MANPFIGEIRMFGGNFAPQGWAFCAGQLLPIAENEALFNLIGTTYGGDGQTTFGLPDLRGRVPLHQGTYQGAGYVIGQSGGSETVTISLPQMPAHAHAVGVSTAAATAAAGPSGVPASAIATPFYSSAAPNTAMNTAGIGVEGGNQPHENMAPFACINFIISLFGIFPSQN